MEYQGLIEDDVINVRALNRAWLRLAATGTEPFAALDEARRRRLADAPFLLFTLRENEMRLWSALLSNPAQTDLFSQPVGADQRELQAACLAYLWGLARRNPFAARVTSGAPLQWCEMVVSYPLIRLLRRTAHADLVRPRFHSESPVHRRLLLRGGSALREARSAAQIAAMQAMLTAAELARVGRLPAAACRMQPPARQFATKV